MKTLKIFGGLAILGLLAACSGGSPGGFAGETYRDAPGIHQQGYINPAQPTGLGVKKAKEIRRDPNMFKKSGSVPPVGYQGQWWTDPDTGCEYSRAGFAHQVNWTLIMNPPGKPMALASCVKHFISEGPVLPGYRHVGGDRYVYDAGLDPLLNPDKM